MKKKIEKIQYIDYACKVGERVWWTNFNWEKRYEGILIEWKENSLAVIKMDDGTIKEIQC